MVKAKKPNKIDGYLKRLLSKLDEIPVEKIPEVSLNFYMSYLSVKHFDKLEMAWFGPLALHLLKMPSGEGGASIGLLGTTISLPNAQQVGLSMLAVLGIMNFLTGIDIPVIKFDDPIAEFSQTTGIGGISGLPLSEEQKKYLASLTG